MILSLMVLFLCFTAWSPRRDLVRPAGALRYNRRHEIVVEILSMAQFSSRNGILDSGSGWQGGGAGAAESREWRLQAIESP
jgi:hypothetical protein